jgi:hypothetical protein
LGHFISANEILRIAVNLKYDDLSCLVKFNDLYHLKSTGFVLPFSFIEFSKDSLNCLHNIFFIPFVEATSDRFSFGFRPYRDYYDFFLSVKKIFIKNKNFSYCFKTRIKLIFSLETSTNFWLLKNFPLNKGILVSWLKIGYKNKIDSIPSYFFDATDIYSTFCNFVFNGLL